MKNILLVMFVIFSLSVHADDGMCDFFKNQAVGKSIPEQAPFTNEVVNLYDLEEGVIGHLILSDKEMQSVTCELSDEPTYKAYIKDLETLEDILDADDKFETFKEKESSGDIILKAVGVMNKIKLFFGKIFLKFF